MTDATPLHHQSKLHYLICACIFLILPSISAAEEKMDATGIPGEEITTHVASPTLDGVSNLPGSQDKSIRYLPKHIPRKENSFYLFVDQKDRRKKNYNVLYIINTQKSDETFEGEDGDVYIKQEALIDEKWTRTEPHWYSWCGNSYHTVKVPAGTYTSILVANPKDGVKADLRYSFFNHKHDHIHSNSIQGRYNPSHLEEAAQDRMSFGYLPLEQYLDIIYGLKTDKRGDATQAMTNLLRFKNNPRIKRLFQKLIDKCGQTVIVNAYQERKKEEDGSAEEEPFDEQAHERFYQHYDFFDTAFSTYQKYDPTSFKNYFFKAIAKEDEYQQLRTEYFISFMQIDIDTHQEIIDYLKKHASQTDHPLFTSAVERLAIDKHPQAEAFLWTFYDQRKKKFKHPYYEKLLMFKFPQQTFQIESEINYISEAKKKIGCPSHFIFKVRNKSDKPIMFHENQFADGLTLKLRSGNDYHKPVYGTKNTETIPQKRTLKPGESWQVTYPIDRFFKIDEAYGTHFFLTGSCHIPEVHALPHKISQTAYLKIEK